MLCFTDAALAAQDLFVQNPGGRPEVLKNVGLDQKLNAQVPLDINFRDEHGASVTISPALAEQARHPDAGLLQVSDALHRGFERDAEFIEGSTARNRQGLQRHHGEH